MFRGTERASQVYEPAYGQYSESRPYPAFAPDGRTMSQVFFETARAVDAAAGVLPDLREERGGDAQYEKAVVNMISALPIDDSQTLVSISVQISGAGLAAMQRDPAYEAWVLAALEYDFSFKDPWSDLCGGSYVVHAFGAHKEDYHGESWFPDYMDGWGQQIYNRESAASTWQRNTPKRVTSSSSQYSDLAVRLRMERMQRKLSLERKHFETAMLEQASKHRHAVEEMHRTGKKRPELTAPTPRLRGVSGAYMLALNGLGVGDNA